MRETARADQAMLVVHQRVGLAAGNPAVGRKRDGFLQHRLTASCTRSSRGSVGFGELAEGVRNHPLGELNLESVVAQGLSSGELGLGGLAEGGLRRRAGPAAPLPRALPATACGRRRPSAMRTSLIVPPSISRPAATETSAKA